MRTVLLAVTGCALGTAVAGCGSSGVKRVSAPPWVQRANAICKRDDPKIKAAELESGGIDFTPNMVQHWFAELHALGRVGLQAQIPRLVTDAQRAYRLMRYTGNPRPMDSALLRMKRDAATRGVHCSFGALPLSQVQ